MIEYTEVRNFAQGEEEWASHRDSATMDVANTFTRRRTPMAQSKNAYDLNVMKNIGS